MIDKLLESDDSEFSVQMKAVIMISVSKKMMHCFWSLIIKVV